MEFVHNFVWFNLLLQIKIYNSLIEEFIAREVELDPTIYEDYYRKNGCVLLKHRDPQGRRIILGRTAKWDPKVFGFQDITVAVWMLNQWANAQGVDVQQVGITIIWDVTGFSLKHLLATKMDLLYTFANWVKQGISGRLKGYHLINFPKAVNVGYSALKPFLSEKMQRRVKFHKETKSLHTSFNPNTLPEFLGGQMDANKYADEQFMKSLLGSADFFQGNTTYIIGGKKIVVIARISK